MIKHAGSVTVTHEWPMPAAEGASETGLSHTLPTCLPVLIGLTYALDVERKATQATLAIQCAETGRVIVSKNVSCGLAIRTARVRGDSSVRLRNYH